MPDGPPPSLSLKRHLVVGGALALASSLVFLSVVEVGCWLWLRSLRKDHSNPIYYLLQGMADNFHPLFNPQGSFTASNYYPYIGNYWEGDWTRTPPPTADYPDAWVLPTRRVDDGVQPFVRPEKEPGVLRIVTLGGSTMAGFGQTAPERAIPAVMESLLRRAYPEKRIEVVNGAFYVHIAAQEFVTLATKLVLFDPDLVVALDGYNEFIRIYHTPKIPPFWSHSQESIYRAYPRVQTFRGVLSQLAFLLSKRFYCLAIPRAILYNRRFLPSASQVASGKIDPEPFDRALREYLLMHRSLAGFTKAHGIPLVLAAQPSLPYAKTPAPAEQEILESWQKNKPLYRESAAYYWPRFDKGYTELAPTLRGKGVSVLNLIRFFESENDVLYADVCHYSDLGADKLARRLAKEAAAALGLPPRPL